MRDYIQAWANHLMLREPKRTISRRIEVVGEKRKHPARLDYATVEVALEPSERFEVVSEIEESQELKSLRFPDYFIFGLLDFLMIAKSAPIIQVRIVIRDVSYHPVETVPLTFLQTGRDAGKKVYAALISV